MHAGLALGVGTHGVVASPHVAAGGALTHIVRVAGEGTVTGVSVTGLSIGGCHVNNTVSTMMSATMVNNDSNNVLQMLVLSP